MTPVASTPGLTYAGVVAQPKRQLQPGADKAADKVKRTWVAVDQAGEVVRRAEAKRRAKMAACAAAVAEARNLGHTYETLAALVGVTRQRVEQRARTPWEPTP